MSTTPPSPPSPFSRDLLRRIPARALERASRVPAEDAEVWTAFTQALEKRAGAPGVDALRAALANLVGLIVFADPADFEDTVALAEHLGDSRLARLQCRASRILDRDEKLPWTTRAVRRLLVRDLAARLVSAGVDSETAYAIARVSRRVGIDLVFADIDSSREASSIRSVDDLHDAVDHGSLAEWRGLLGVLVRCPWGPDATGLVAIAGRSERPHVMVEMMAVVARCRECYKDREREQVANEIRNLVASSGLSQREFAARIGTSPSRLSSYVSGTVTPSAAVVVRIQRVARAPQRSARVGSGKGGLRPGA